MTPNISAAGYSLWICPTYFEYRAVRKGIREFLYKKHIRLIVSGVGEAKSNKLCEKPIVTRAEKLILIGWAGALTTGLKAGDAIIASSVLRANCPPVPVDWVSLPDVVSGPILTSPVALYTPAQKSAGQQQTGALAVEMEAYPIAIWAQSHQIPFYHVRIILDALDQNLPDIQLGSIAGIFSLFQKIQAVDAALSRLAYQMAAALYTETMPPV